MSKWILPSSDLLAVDVDETSDDPTGVVAVFGPAKAHVFKHLGAAGATRDLVPCQLPQSNGVVFRSPRVVEGNMLVFELEGGDLGKEGPAGLYAVKLDAVLPP